MSTTVFIPIVTHSRGERVVPVVYATQAEAVDAILRASDDYSLRPGRTLHQRAHGNTVTVESEDTKFGYVLVARTAY